MSVTSPSLTTASASDIIITHNRKCHWHHHHSQQQVSVISPSFIRANVSDITITYNSKCQWHHHHLQQQVSVTSPSLTAASVSDITITYNSKCRWHHHLHCWKTPYRICGRNRLKQLFKTVQLLGFTLWWGSLFVYPSDWGNYLEGWKFMAASSWKGLLTQLGTWYIKCYAVSRRCACKDVTSSQHCWMRLTRWQHLMYSAVDLGLYLKTDANFSQYHWKKLRLLKRDHNTKQVMQYLQPVPGSRDNSAKHHWKILNDMATLQNTETASLRSIDEVSKLVAQHAIMMKVLYKVKDE